MFVKGEQELAALFTGANSAIPSASSRNEIHDRYSDVPLIVRTETSEGVAKWLLEMSGAAAPGGPHHLTGVFDFRPDIVITSIAPEVELLTPPEAETIEEFKTNAATIVKMLRLHLNANVFWCNATTVDVNAQPTNHYGLSVEPRSLRVHRLCLALVDLSHEFGISIIDVDRILGEAGFQPNMNAGSEATRPRLLVRKEIFRVLEDYGYFDERPITAQVGQNGSRAI